MKNKNILVGLGFGLLANINNKTKNRSSDIISNDGEYLERIIKLINTSEESDFQLRVRNLKNWKGGNIDSSQISLEVIDNNGNIITRNLEGSDGWEITFNGTWDSAIDDNIRVQGEINNFFNSEYIEYIEFFEINNKFSVYKFYNYNNNDIFLLTLINKEQLIEYFKESLKKKEFPYDLFILFVKEIPELFFKTLRENYKLSKDFLESLEKDSDLSKKFKENDKLLIKKKSLEVISFFEKKSKLLNDIDSLLEKKPEVLIKHDLWITEKSELQNTLKKLIEENYKLSEDVLKLKNKIKETISKLENIYSFFDYTQPELLSLAKELQEDNTKLELFIDSIEIYPLLSKNFKETFELSENLLKLKEEKEKLIKIEDFLAEAESFFKTKSKILNYFTPSVIENPEFLIEYKLLIIEKPELQKKLEEFLKEKPELLNKLKSLLESE